MEAVIFVGLQASGKSTFFMKRFFRTHVRISLDLLKTRYREKLFMDACIATDMRFVIDNTNPTRAERLRYVEAAKANPRYSIVGYHFESRVEDCLRRNADRPEAERVPDVGILSAAKRFEVPSFEEGFDRLFHVSLREGGFVAEEWEK